MSLTTSTTASPLVTLAVYCPLLCQDKEERAEDNTLFFFPTQAHPNRQMNHIGFCTAMSSLAPRFGVLHSTRQTIRRVHSSVCLCSPIADLWATAHVRGGGHGEVETTHQLLQLSFALFTLLYGPAVLRRLTQVPGEADSEAVSANLSPSCNRGNFAEARAVLQSFFSKCAHFFSAVLVAQREAAAAGASSVVPFRPSPSMTSAQWARYLSAEAMLGFPLRYVNPHELPRRLLGGVEDTVQRVLWPRTWTEGDAPRCCVFCLPSLYVLSADSRLPCAVLRALKYYFLLYAPITATTFVCRLPDEAAVPCDVAVWLEANVLVVLIERQGSPSSRPAATSLLQCAKTIGMEVRRLLLRSAAGLTTPMERDAYWIASCDIAQHTAQYTTVPLPTPPAAVRDALVVHLRLGGGVVEGTSLVHLWPPLVERIRTLVSVTKLTAMSASASSSDVMWESWARWGPMWIYVRVAGPAATVLAWRSPPTVRHLFSEARRTLLLQS